MALNDVKCGFRQYIVLICAYFLGTMILLFPQHVLNTLQSPPYLKYWDVLPSDFCAPYYNGNLIKAYEKSLKAGEKVQQIKIFSWLEEEAKRNGIDIQIDVTKVARYDCYIGDETPIETLCYFGEVDTRDYEYTKVIYP